MASTVRELVLASADVGVVNQTTLSLWHFQQLLGQLVPPEGEPDEPEEPRATDDKENQAGLELGEGMSVAAVRYESAGGVELHQGSDRGLSVAPIAVAQAVMVPETQVAVVYRRYRCAICLDTSPSTLSIDPATGRVFLDLLFESVEVRLRLLSPRHGSAWPGTDRRLLNATA